MKILFFNIPKISAQIKNRLNTSLLEYHCNKRKIKNLKLTFRKVDNEKIIKEIKRLNKNKASQKPDIPITIIHENADIFADFLAESLKGAIKTYES